MSSKGIRKVVFAGSDEVAEIAYITLHETNMELVGVLDEASAGKDFFGKKIKSLNALSDLDFDCIVITSYLKREKLYKELLSHGVAKKAVRVIFHH
jgi:methionyl-tRNA formyltransferase